MLIGDVIAELLALELFPAFFALIQFLWAILKMDLQISLLDTASATQWTVDLKLANELLNAAADFEPLWQGFLALRTLPLRQTCEALFAEDGATSVAIEWRLRQLHTNDALKGIEVDSLAGQVSDATRH